MHAGSACPLTCGEPVSAYFEKMGDDMKHIHFIDCISSSEDHLIPGDGEIDFPRLVSYLKEVGYDGYLSLELFSRYANEPDFAAREAMSDSRPAGRELSLGNSLDGGKLVREAASSLLVSGFSCQFSHRMSKLLQIWKGVHISYGKK